MKRRVLAAGAVAAALVAAMALPAAAAVITTPDPFQLALANQGTPLGGAAFDTLPPAGTPTAFGDTPLAEFPTEGPTSAILSTGNAVLADQPGVTASTNNNGGPVRGGTERDVTTLRIDFFVPGGLNCAAFDFKFLTDQGVSPTTDFNDAFIAELDASTWTTSGGVVNAPDNFAFDQNGQLVSVRTGAASMSPVFAQGTAYETATPLLTAATPVGPGPHTLFLTVFDQGSNLLDSAAFVDNLRVGFADSPGTCRETVPPDAVNQVGTTHVIDARLFDADTTAPVPGIPLLFMVDGANPNFFVIPTSPAGEANVAYVGQNPGLDQIVVCADVNLTGGCDPDDPQTTVLKFWEPTPPPLIALDPLTDKRRG